MEGERPEPLGAREANIPIPSESPCSAAQMRTFSSTPDGNAPAQRPNIVQQSYPNYPAAARQQTSHLFKIRQKIKQVQGFVQNLDRLLQKETNVLNRAQLLKDRDTCLMYYWSFQKQCQHYEATQSSQRKSVQTHLQHQTQLQQQQMQQTTHEQHQAQMRQQHMAHEDYQQQLRSQQLQQRLAESEYMFQLMNAYEMRPAVEISGVPSGPKQARTSINLPNETGSTEVNNESSENMSAVRPPTGVTLRVLSQSENVSPPTLPRARTGSRHSSGSTSPAVQSPGSVSTRLAQSDINLTIPSPAPLLLPLSPPVNPMHSPISDCSPSPSTSPPIQTTSLVQRTPSAPNLEKQPQQPPLMVNDVSTDSKFDISRAPLSNRGPVAIAANAERHRRPPTIDLTEHDDIQNHNTNMRTTGGVVVKQEQIQNHNKHRDAGLSLTYQYRCTHRPQVSLKPVACFHCNVSFGSVESLQEHWFRVHEGRGQQQFDQPEPPVLSNIPRTVAPEPIVPVTANTTSREQEILEDGDSLIPVLDLSKLNNAELRTLNDLGVTSFIPVEGIRRLGIPIIRLSNAETVRFPHDSVTKIEPTDQQVGVEPERVVTSVFAPVLNNGGSVSVISRPVNTNDELGPRNGVNFDPIMFAREQPSAFHSYSRDGNLPGSIKGNNHTGGAP